MNSYLCIFQSIVHLESYIPENCIVASIFNLLCLTSDLNSWTSNFLVTHSDQSIEVSSTAQGSLSSSPPSGVYQQQNIQYPCTKYSFDIWYLCEGFTYPNAQISQMH